MLATQDNLDLVHRLVEIRVEMSAPGLWGLDVSLVKLEMERSVILEELGMALADYLLKGEPWCKTELSF